MCLGAQCCYFPALLDRTGKKRNDKMRTCLTEKNVKMEVHCNEDSINIVLEKSGELALYAEYLRLGHSNCTLHSNGTHLLASISLKSCHTQRKDDSIYVIYSNIVSMNHSEAQQPEVDIAFVCKYLKPPSHKRPVSFKIKGFGTFTYQFEFFESAAFTQQKGPSSYPLEFNIGEMMYMQIESITAIPDTELFAESCWATPTANALDHLSHSIIENGCKVDETLHMYTDCQSKVQFSMEAFKFKEYYDQIFISCSVILCKAGAPDSRCAQGCSSHVTASGHKHKILARDTSVQTSGHIVSQGPLRIRHSVSSHEVKSLDPNFVFCLGALLVAVGMVYIMVTYRSQESIEIV